MVGHLEAHLLVNSKKNTRLNLGSIIIHIFHNTYSGYFYINLIPYYPSPAPKTRPLSKSSLSLSLFLLFSFTYPFVTLSLSHFPYFLHSSYSLWSH